MAAAAPGAPAQLNRLVLRPAPINAVGRPAVSVAAGAEVWLVGSAVPLTAHVRDRLGHRGLRVRTFGWDEPGHPIPPGSTTIEISLHREGSKTRVRLVHSGLPPEAVSDHGEGWSFYLDRLAVVAPGGTVGPDRGSKPS